MDRERLFGKFAFVGAPTPQNPEAIRITDDWAEKNLVKVSIAALPDAAQHGVENVRVHRQVALSFCALLEAWADVGVIDRILRWDGSYVPRYKRGRAPAPGQPPNIAALSAHSWGSAFDINARWNPLGREPAAPGHEGSVWDLVDIAEDLGWVWGGRFRTAPDGMHFEAGPKCVFKGAPQ
jgi:hypothetical protein